MERTKYIKNKDLLAEIHRSKLTYCHYIDPDCTQFDEIVDSIGLLTPEFIEAARRRRAARLSSKTTPVDPESIDPETLVFRVMTTEHIPSDPARKRRTREADEEMQAKVPFPAFKHYKVIGGKPVEVLRSHWKGDFETGHFCIDHGKMTNRLAIMFMMLVDRYSRRGNWRGYTYVDEMRSHALLQLSQIGLQFDESKSDNPFAFYTQVIKNCFTRVLHLERRNQNIRDDLLIMAGVNPSFTRQIEHEMAERAEEQQPQTAAQAADVTSTDAKQAPKKRGRKPKAEVT